MTSSVAFYGSAPGLGTTALVYHLAHLYAERGVRVLTIDFDPNAGLTRRYALRAYLGTDQRSGVTSVAGIDWRVGPLLTPVAENLTAVFGVPRVVQREAPDELSRLFAELGEQCGAETVLVDLAAGHFALNRVAVMAADHVVSHWAPGMIAGFGIDELLAWQREGRVPHHAGYLVRDSPTAELGHGLARLGTTRGYPSLDAMARGLHKPVFKLTAADGALGSHLAAVGQAYDDLTQLADRVAAATWRSPAAGAPTP